MDAVRERVEQLMIERGDDCLSISRLLNRNAAYVQQFLRRGTPRKLNEDDRRVLARYFGVDEVDLGGPPLPTIDPGTVMVPRLELGASAGPGSLPGAEEANSRIGFEAKWLKRLTTSPDALSIIQVAGDSMSPTLGDGDDILVDTKDASERLRDGIYVLRMDDTLLVKRIAIGSMKRLSVLSDNPVYPSSADVDPTTISVIGRVIWTGRKIG
jgi:Peptidase S24-like